GAPTSPAARRAHPTGPGSSPPRASTRAATTPTTASRARSRDAARAARRTSPGAAPRAATRRRSARGGATRRAGTRGSRSPRSGRSDPGARRRSPATRAPRAGPRRRPATATIRSPCRRAPLPDDAEAFPHLRERRDRLLEVVRFVAGGDLHADARLAHRDDGEAEADDVDALGEELFREVLRELRVAEHDRADRVDAGADLEAGLRHLLAEPLRVGLELVAQRGRAGDQVEDPDRRRDDGRRDRVAEEVGPAALAQQRDDLRLRRDEAAGRAAERLAE